MSHKKAESWAAGHSGILWTQLTRTSGHTSSCYTSYFCPIKAAHISFKRHLSLICHCFSSLKALRKSKGTRHHVAGVLPKLIKYNGAINFKKHITKYINSVLKLQKNMHLTFILRDLCFYAHFFALRNEALQSNKVNVNILYTLNNYSEIECTAHMAVLQCKQGCDL